MNLRPIDIQHRKRLILLFAGWAMDENPFRGLRHTAYDIAVAYDYRSLDCRQEAELKAYDEICVLAWSFGVINAALFIEHHSHLPITAKIAVNGTLHPIDNALGIPEAIFNGTLDGLSPATLNRFYRRVCGSATAMQSLKANMPQRDIRELADELRAIAALPHRPDLTSAWDMVYIASSDMIIPTANQIKAWEGHHGVRIVEGAHMIDFRQIINDCIIDKPLVTTRFSNSSKTYDDNATAQRQIVDTLARSIERLSTDASPDIIEIGAGTGMLSRRLATLTHSTGLTLWDITPIDSSLPGTHLTCDGETEIRRIADESVDIIASASTIQWFNSPLSFLREAFRVLKPGGLIALSTFGADNFSQLADFLPTRLHYLDCRQWIEDLRRIGFSETDVTDDRITLSFPGPTDMLRHIKMTGVNAKTTDPLSARRIINAGIKELTYHPIYILARK